MAVNISRTYDRFSLPVGALYRICAGAIGAKDTDALKLTTGCKLKHPGDGEGKHKT